MRVLFVGSPEAVKTAVTGGFRSDTERVRLLEAAGARSAVNGQDAVLLEIPESTLAPFEQANGSPDSPRTFLLPGDIADRYPPLAVRGRGLPHASQPARRRTAALVAAAAAIVAAAVGVAALSSGGEGKPEKHVTARAPSGAAPQPRKVSTRPKPLKETIPVRHSRAIGTPTGGSLVGGVALPAEGRNFFTWEVPRHRSPNPRFRRYGAYAVVRKVLRSVDAYRAAHPRAARVGIGDLSLPHGGKFGVEYGGTGHTGHQNGLEVDVLYPRRDGAERAVGSLRDIDGRLAQDLLRQFLRLGATRIVVAPESGLRGPGALVQQAPFHEEHMHVRFPAG